MRTLYRVFAVTGALATAVVGAGRLQAAPSVVTASLSPFLAEIPDHLEATSVEGKTVDIATQPGWRVVYFWSVECPCVTACEEYSFVPLAKRYSGKVSFYGVVSGAYDLDQGTEKLTAAIKNRDLPYPVLLDTNHSVAKAFGASVTPQTFVIDPENHVVFSGMADDSRNYFSHLKPNGVHHTYLSEALEEALAGKPVAHPTNELQGCIIAW